MEEEPHTSESRRSTSSGIGGSWFDRTSAAESTEFAEHLAGLTKTGLPLPSGLRALATEIPSPRLRTLLNETAEQLDLGRPLDAALLGQAARFPQHLRGLLLAGAESGNLADVLNQYVRNANLGAALRRRFYSAITYPCVLLVLLVLLYLFVCYEVVGAFETILRDFKSEIPPITNALILMARATRESGLLMAAQLGVIALIAFGFFRFFMDAADRRRCLKSIPLFGPILRWSALAEYCHLVGLLVDTRMPLPDALALAGDGVNDAELAKVGTTLRKSVTRGKSLTDALEDWPGCPAGLRDVLADSEHRGNLGSTLHLAGDMFEAWARAQSSFAGSFLAAVLILLMLWGVGFVLTALYLPIYNLFRGFM